MKTVSSLTLSALLSLFLLACSTPAIDPMPADEFVTDGLHAVSGSGFEAAYVLPGADLPAYGQLDFARFDASAVEVTSTTVTGTTRRDWQITPEREARLAEAWRNATNHAFADYPREEATAGTLKTEATLTRLSPGRATSTSAVAAGSASSVNRDVVNVSVEFRLRDADSGQLLAVIRDRQTIGSLQWTRAAGADMANLFNSWAALLHTRISGR